MAKSSSESSPQRSLLYDLCSQLVVWKTISGKDWKLLSSDQGGQSVDCGNTGVDIVSGIFTCYRVSAADH